jgi:hypothetical protein
LIHYPVQDPGKRKNGQTILNHGIFNHNMGVDDTIGADPSLSPKNRKRPDDTIRANPDGFFYVSSRGIQDAHPLPHPVIQNLLTQDLAGTGQFPVVVNPQDFLGTGVPVGRDL